MEGARGRSHLESLMRRYERRKLDLERREASARQRVEAMESAMPALMAVNMYKMLNMSGMAAPPGVQEVAQCSVPPAMLGSMLGMMGGYPMMPPPVMPMMPPYMPTVLATSRNVRRRSNRQRSKPKVGRGRPSMVEALSGGIEELVRPKLAERSYSSSSSSSNSDEEVELNDREVKQDRDSTEMVDNLLAQQVAMRKQLARANQEATQREEYLQRKIKTLECQTVADKNLVEMMGRGWKAPEELLSNTGVGAGAGRREVEPSDL